MLASGSKTQPGEVIVLSLALHTNVEDYPKAMLMVGLIPLKAVPDCQYITATQQSRPGLADSESQTLTVAPFLKRQSSHTGAMRPSESSTMPHPADSRQRARRPHPRRQQQVADQVREVGVHAASTHGPKLPAVDDGRAQHRWPSLPGHHHLRRGAQQGPQGLPSSPEGKEASSLLLARTAFGRRAAAAS